MNTDARYVCAWCEKPTWWDRETVAAVLADARRTGGYVVCDGCYPEAVEYERKAAEKRKSVA